MSASCSLESLKAEPSAIWAEAMPFTSLWHVAQESAGMTGTAPWQPAHSFLFMTVCWWQPTQLLSEVFACMASASFTNFPSLLPSTVWQTVQDSMRTWWQVRQLSTEASCALWLNTTGFMPASGAPSGRFALLTGSRTVASGWPRIRRGTGLIRLNLDWAASVWQPAQVVGPVTIAASMAAASA